MPLREGSVIGDRYRLIGKIGEGGTATVWEAEHVALHNAIAVKFLHRTAPKGSETAERFLREARVAASVKHRNVVDITDFGFTNEEVPYMVMERLHGQSLARYLEVNGQLDFQIAVRLASLTLRGLAAVHDAGIVHRDLKPDNIFLVSDEDGPFPKLLDFGLSRRAGRGDITLDGALLGTPDYMSPEQARGMSDLDSRTDIYSMGVILYEMIAGGMPFQTELVGDLIAMIVREPPTPLLDFRPDTPPELVEVIERAMGKERNARFPDAREMRLALVESWNGTYVDRSSETTSFSEIPPFAIEDEFDGNSLKRTTGSRRVVARPASTPPLPQRANPAKETLAEASTLPSVGLPTSDFPDDLPTQASQVSLSAMQAAQAVDSDGPAAPRRSAVTVGIAGLFAAASLGMSGLVWMNTGPNESPPAMAVAASPHEEAQDSDDEEPSDDELDESESQQVAGESESESESEAAEAEASARRRRAARRARRRRRRRQQQ